MKETVETSDILDPLRFLQLRDNLRGKLLMKIKNFSICNCHTIQTKFHPKLDPIQNHKMLFHAKIYA